MATADATRSSRIPFRNVYVYFALLLPATVIAFSKLYFAGETFSGRPATVLVHVHTALMTLWLLMLITQAWLIRTKRVRPHRWVGRSSFIATPVIVLSALVVQHEQFNYRAEVISPEDARIAVFAFGQALAFAVTWGLAIVYRRQASLHLRFMISTAFAISTAILFRILLSWVPGFDSIESVAAANWLLLTLSLLALIAADWRNGMTRSPFWVVTVLIGIMHLGFWTFAKTAGWLAFTEWYARLP
jgi:hypothetical protein